MSACGLNHVTTQAGRDGLGDRVRGPAAVDLLRLGAQEADADIQHDQAAEQQDDHLQPFIALHDRAHAEKARERERHVEKDDDERRQKCALSRVRQRRVDDE